MARVIVKFLTGEDIAGDVMLFNINKPTFSPQVETAEEKSRMQAVRIDSVKMILFLKKEGSSSSL